MCNLKYNNWQIEQYLSIIIQALKIIATIKLIIDHYFSHLANQTLRFHKLAKILATFKTFQNSVFLL